MSRLILSGNGSYLEGLYVQWYKLKTVMLKFIGWCTLDIKISMDNCSLLKLHRSQSLQRIFGQHIK